MSLLTPSESRAFQSFLDAAAFPLPVDWNMQLEISHEHMPPARGTEALTKATKDLMSLDGDKWRYPLAPYSPGETSVTSVHRRHNNSLQLLYSTRQQRPLVGNADEADLPNPLPAQLYPSNSHTQLAQPPIRHIINSTADPRRSGADPHPYDRSSSSSSSRHSPIDLLASSSSTARLPTSAKRSPSPDAKPSSKRHRPTSQDHPDEAQLLPQSRVSLLSPSQKKANHIQSEQKRRANIRRGYDTLCETIPALREACQAEDEQQLIDGKSKSRRRGKGKAKNDDGERIDGRAGPRSENVVLSKTIDYLQELLSERDALMQRFYAARSALPADHPLLHSPPDAPLPLWERKWTGGEERDNDDDDDVDDD